MDNDSFLYRRTRSGETFHNLLTQKYILDFKKMRKFLLFAIFIFGLFFVSPRFESAIADSTCDSPGEECCDPNTGGCGFYSSCCTGPVICKGTFCGDPNCGGQGETCCTLGDQCDELYLSCNLSSSLCERNCDDIGDSCCVGIGSGGPFGECDGGLDCTGGVGGTCQPAGCGGQGQTCCTAGNPCDYPYLACNVTTNICERNCDDIGDSCCPVMGTYTCDGGWVCNGGVCAVNVPGTPHPATCATETGIMTAFGCIRFDSVTTVTKSFLDVGIGIAGGIAFLIIVWAGLTLLTSSGNPEKVKHGQELLTAAIAGLVMIILSIIILRIIGVNILGLGLG